MDSVKSALLMEIFNSLSANNTDEKILNFADIVSGWHFGEGISISAGAIRDASKLHNAFLVHGFYETDAFPGLAGEIRVTACHGNQYFEFTREPDGEWSYIYELDGTVQKELDNLTMEQVEEIVRNASNDIWNTFDIFQDITGIPVWEGFKASRFDHQPKVAFRLWKSLAPPLSGPSVSTSGYSFPQQVSRQSFGYSRMQYYQTPPQLSNRRAKQMTSAIETSPEFPAKNHRKYSSNFAASPMISKSVRVPTQDNSALQTWLRLNLP